MEEMRSDEAQALAEQTERLEARVARLEDYTAQLGRYTREEHRFVTYLGDKVDHGIAVAKPLPPAPPARRAQRVAAATAPAPSSPAPAPAPAETPSPPSWRADLEDLLGGRLLGLAGGLAVLLGIAFFVAVAIGRGWIDEPARVVLALAASLGLTVGGALLYERRGRTQAALAAVGAGIAGLFLSLIAATQLYDLVPAFVALAGALGAGALATALSVRWDARTIGGLGILGALASPVLVGAGSGDVTAAFLAVALAAAVGVLVWRRWEWLSVASFCVVAPQLMAWAYGEPSIVALIVVPALFWALFAAAALGYELRVRAERPRPSSVGLILVAGALTAGIAWGGLDYAGHRALADAFLAALAVAHLGLGLGALRSRRVARAFGLVLIAGAIALGDIAFALVFTGPVQVAGWALSAVLMAGLRRVAPEERDLLRLGLGAQLALAAVHALAVDATPGALVDGGADVPRALAALGLVALAALACARLNGDRPQVRIALDAVAMAAVAYLTAFALDGAALASAWAAQAVALGQVARRHRDEAARIGSLAFLGLGTGYLLAFVVGPEAAFASPQALGDPVLALVAVGAAAFALARQRPGTPAAVAADALAAALLAFGTAVVLEGPLLAIAWAAQATSLLTVSARLRGIPAPSTVAVEELPKADLALTAHVMAFAAAVCLAGLAAIHALVFEAPVDALVLGVDGLTGATGALLAVAAAGLAATRLAPRGPWRTGGGIAAAVALVYLGSVSVVSAFQPDAVSFHTGLGGLEVRQEGQVLLSAFWGAVGLAALVAGLVLGRRPVRVAGLGLLVLAIAKVFAFDLASLDSIYRVTSLVGLGLVLLAGAFAWQRLRPGSPPAPATSSNAGSAQ